MLRHISKPCLALAMAMFTLPFTVIANDQQTGSHFGIPVTSESLHSTSTVTSSGLPQASADTDRPRHLTLAQAKQQASRAISPLNRLGQLSLEAARQHRLAVQADYFPKVSGTFWNLHFNKFMGQVLTTQGRILGTPLTRGVPLVGENQTFVAATVAQPVTPLLKIHQAVILARADERIARAKAGMSVSETSGTVEKAYFELLIVQRKEAIAEAHARKAQMSPAMIASTAPMAVNLDKYEIERMEASKELAEASTKLEEATSSFNELLGWAPGTKLELEPPSPLVEDRTFQEVADQAVATNPEVVEAEQNLVKAHAASKLAKLAYVPDVVGMWGYAYNNNVIPVLPGDFSFVGVMASYTVFDFGKREHTIKERDAQVGMAEAALQLTKAKVAAGIKQTYFELVRSRQVSEMTQQADSVIRSIALKYAADDPEVEASRAKLEIEMLQADLEHRQVYAKLRSLLGNTSDGR